MLSKPSYAQVLHPRTGTFVFLLLCFFSAYDAGAWTLTVNKTGDGFGDVLMSPSPISQNGNVYEFSNGTEVELNGFPRLGSLFSSWTGGDEEPYERTILVNMYSNRTVTVEFVFFGGPDVSAAANYSPFIGYADRMSDVKVEWATGSGLISGLEYVTEYFVGIKHFRIFSHAWFYQSSVGSVHNGGVWASQSIDNSGFYGTVQGTDDAAARDVGDLQDKVSGHYVKFVPPIPAYYSIGSRNLVFVEGCHVFETGSFVTDLRGVTDCHVVAPCGASSEADIGSGFVEFSSAAENYAELQDSDYDGWKKSKANDASVENLGSSFTVP